MFLGFCSLLNLSYSFVAGGLRVRTPSLIVYNTSSIAVNPSYPHIRVYLLSVCVIIISTVETRRGIGVHLTVTYSSFCLRSYEWLELQYHLSFLPQGTSFSFLSSRLVSVSFFWENIDLDTNKILNRFKVYKSDALFDLDYSILREGRCPLCFNKLRILGNGKRAICAGKKHKKAFTISCD